MSKYSSVAFVPLLALHRLSVCCLALSSIFLVGCGRQDEARLLVSSGKQASSALAEYYDSLAQEAVEILEMEAYLGSVRGIPLTPSAEKRMHEQVAALHSRSKMAHDLGRLYAALGELANYDARAEVQGATEGLSSSLNSVLPLPQAPSSTAGLFSQAAGFLVARSQSKKIKTHVAHSKDLLTALLQAFQQEKEAYNSYSQERALKSHSIVAILLDKKRVSGWPLLRDVPSSVGLELRSTDPGDDAQSLAAFKEIVRVKQTRAAFYSSSAADKIIAALEELLRMHTEFLEERPLSTATFSALLAKANTYLDEALKARSTAKKSKGDLPK